MSPHHSIRIIPGQVSDTTAQLYVQADVSDSADGYALSGVIDGPHLHNAHTLPATIRFRDLGPGDSVLVETIVPDPCVWTPDCPALYDLSLDLSNSQGEVVEQFRRKTGIPSFGVYKNSFYLNSKRFVPRLIHEDLLGSHSLRDLGEARLGLFVKSPAEDLLLDSSRLGIPLLVESPLADLDVLSTWPSVCGVLLVEKTLAEEDKARFRQNRLPVVGRLAVGQTLPMDAWIVAEDATPNSAPFELPTGVVESPIVFAAKMPDTEESDLNELRGQCDLIQTRTAQTTRGAGFLLLPANSDVEK